MIFTTLFTVDKAGKFLPSHTPSFNNLSRISLPKPLGFINLNNNSMDSRTLSESLEGFPRPPRLRGKICAVRLIMTNLFHGSSKITLRLTLGFRHKNSIWLPMGSIAVNQPIPLKCSTRNIINHMVLYYSHCYSNY